MDVSIGATETRSVTDISVMKSIPLLPPCSLGDTRCRTLGFGHSDKMEGGENSNATDTSAFIFLAALANGRLVPPAACLCLCSGGFSCDGMRGRWKSPPRAPRPLHSSLPLQREVNMRDATDDPLWRSGVWLRNPFSIQRGERSRAGTGTERRWVENGGCKESP